MFPLDREASVDGEALSAVRQGKQTDIIVPVAVPRFAIVARARRVELSELCSVIPHRTALFYIPDQGIVRLLVGIGNEIRCKGHASGKLATALGPFPVDGSVVIRREEALVIVGWDGAIICARVVLRS